MSGPKRIDFPKGIERTYAYTISNEGGESAKNVNFDLDTDLSVDVTPEQVGVIDPDSEIDLEISGTPTETGIHSFELRAVPDTGEQSSLSITAGIASVKDYLHSALQDVQRLQSRIDESNTEDADEGGRGKNGGGNRGSDGMKATLESVEQSLKQAIDRIEEGRGKKPVENKIMAAINQLETFINQTNAADGNRIDDGDAALLRKNAKEIIPRLETARNANR